jgi:hypothetical protein
MLPNRRCAIEICDKVSQWHKARRNYANEMPLAHMEAKFDRQAARHQPDKSEMTLTLIAARATRRMKMKHAKSRLFARPPSPLAGGY